MPTTPDDLRSVGENLRTVLGTLADNFPGPCPPLLPPEPVPAPLAQVRELFGTGAQWADRAGWEAAMGRPSKVRSEWASGQGEDAHVTWWRNKVNGILADDGKTIYVIGLHPHPGSTFPPAAVPSSYYQRVAAELARLGARALRVFIRFGWEPDGDWYPWSWRPKGAPFSEVRYASFVRNWMAFTAVVDPARVVLNLTAGATPALAERAIRDLHPRTYTMDIYATYEGRSVTFWLRRLTEQVELAARYGIPWAIDETSPYVDKIVGTEQKGGLDSKLSVELLHALVWFVQVQAGAGRAPLWVQLFERNSPEGKFSIVSAPLNVSASGITAYRAANGVVRYTTAPRTAAALVSLLGTPS